MQKVKLGDICTKQSSAYAQKDLNDLEGEYPIYGASGFIKKINIYHQDKDYVAVVKDGAGIGRTMYLPAKSSVIGTLQYLIPKEKDKVYIKSVIIGAIVNLIANIIFIPIFSSVGACIGTILAEFSVLVVQILHIRKEVKCIEYVFGNFNFVYKGLLMLVIVYIVSSIEINLLTKLLLEISTGIVVYSLLNIKYIHKIVKIRGKI